MQFHYVDTISPNMRLLPSGVLLCENVPVARTGVQLYAPFEVSTKDNNPIKPCADGVVRVLREPEDVFADSMLNSLNGAPVTIDHKADIGPDNWQQHAVGVALNARRGKGTDDDLAFVDLMIHDAATIKRVRDKAQPRQISVGYDAEYVPMQEIGYAKQRNIIANHVAILDAGRCGTRCAIGDKQTVPAEEKEEPVKLTQRFKDAIRSAFNTKDENALKTVLDASMDDPYNDEGSSINDSMKRMSDAILKFSDGQTKTNDTLKTIDARLTTLETRDKAITDADKADEDDKKEGVKDSALLVATAQDVRARAEILSPGIQFPTLDAAKGKKGFLDALCGVRRKALDAALAGQLKEAVAPFLNGKTVDSLECGELSAAFIGASEIAKRMNNGGGTAATTYSGTGDGAPFRMQGLPAKRTADGKTVVDIQTWADETNAKNAAFWAQKAK